MDEKLIRAAELIEGNWTTGRYVDVAGQLCMSGAIAQAQMTEEDLRRAGPFWSWWFDALNRVEPETWQRIAKVLPTVCSGCHESDYHAHTWQDWEAAVIHFNDHHCTGDVEAAKLLREAAEVEL